MSFSSTVSMTSSQKVTLNAQCLDVCGCPFDAPSTPAWTNTDDTIATITPAGDNLSCDVIAVATGFTDVSVTVNDKTTTTRVQVNAPVLNVVQVTANTPVMQ
jgi:hypothetical protein